MKDSLGRGFESLIPTDLFDDEFDPTAAEDSSLSTLKELPLSQIVVNEKQPRKHFDENALGFLADSIRTSGVLQPIVVTKIDGGKYQIVAGERRYRASKMAGLKTIPAIIRTLNDQNRLEISIIENAQREDLNPLELATAYAKLKTQFNMSSSDIASKIGKSEISVDNTMRLLNLPDFAKEAMIENRLTEGVMRPLTSLDPSDIEKLLPKIINESWTARMVEKAVAGLKKPSSESALKKRQTSANELSLLTSLEPYHATKVSIKSRSLSFSFKSENDLNAFLESIKQL